MSKKKAAVGDKYTDYDSFEKDVIGDDDEDIDMSEDKKKKDEKATTFMVFDFRKGKENWPENCEIVDMKRGEDLLEKAKEAAEEAIRLRKKEADDAEMGKKGASGGSKSSGTSASDSRGGKATVGFSSFGDSLGTEQRANDPAFGKDHPDCLFEKLNDGSYAYILKPGIRLKLNLMDMLDGGDANKERRKKFSKFDTKKFSKGTGAGTDGEGGGDDEWEDFDMEDFSMDFGGAFRSIKHYMNAFTITIDMKLTEQIPNGGFSLFQTALIHTSEKRSGQASAQSSEGECLVSPAGGIGMFGTYGDTTKARLEVDKWKRVVVSVKCGDGKTEKGEMKTWVNSESGVVLKEESIQTNDRFSLDLGGLYMFSSNSFAMMPGNIAIRMIKIEDVAATDETVKANRASDKLTSMFNEERKTETEQQRKGLSLAKLFAKPRPMWIAPAFVAAFGDAYIERTSLENSSNLAWSFAVLNFALQRLVENPLLRGDFGFDYNANVAISDTLLVLDKSVHMFRHMMKLQSTPNESMLLSFLKKVKVEIESIRVKESLLMPISVRGRDLLMLLERNSDRAFNVVVINTSHNSGLPFHAASPVEAMPQIKYRTCLVLKDVPKKNVYDDVFWMAVYNLALKDHRGDVIKFYEILLPFLTGKPLESSLVEGERDALQCSEDNLSSCGSYRFPTKSNTGHVHCVLEAVNYMLRRRGLSVVQADLLHLGLCLEMISMMKNDAGCVLPDDNGIRICSLSLREMSRLTLDLIQRIEQHGNPHKINISELLSNVNTLIESTEALLNACSTNEHELPAPLDLTGPADANNASDPAMMQFMNALCWDVPDPEPDPGQQSQLRKYLPVDVLQIPQRVTCREDAIKAIHMCERLCNLLGWQDHCIKNDKFLICSLIEYVFVQVLPIPKPRKVAMNDTERHVAGRAGRRAEAKAAKEKEKAEEKKRKLDEIKRAKEEASTPGGRLAAEKKRQKSGKLDRSGTAAEAKCVENSAVSATKCFGVEEKSDFDVGTKIVSEVIETSCIWDEPITYELQVELLLSLQRLTEHFAAAAMSIQQSRPFDGVCVIVPGCIAAIADAIIRKISINHPSEVCSHLMGRTIDGQQLGHPGFGISVGSFATQSETIEIHSPELCLARTAVLDYFQSPAQSQLQKIFTWEEAFDLKPQRTLIKFLRMITHDLGMKHGSPHLLLEDSKPDILMKPYPEFRCYRDIVFFWKFFLNTDRKAFPNYIPPDKKDDVKRQEHYNAALTFEWDNDSNSYVVKAFGGAKLKCRPDPSQVNPATGKVIPPENLPVHRFPSTATPSFYVPPPAIKTEDDVIYRANLPSFEDRFGQVLNQRDSELLISYLTVPYLRLPLLLSFFASEDRIHKLQSKELRLILDSVIFEPGKYLRMDMCGVVPMMVPTANPELLATSYGLLLNELCRSPETVIRSVLVLLRGALACDTGSVVDKESSAGKSDKDKDKPNAELNTSTKIILYCTRLGSRVDNYLSLLIDWATKSHDCIDYPLRETEISDYILEQLIAGRKELRDLLGGSFRPLFEDYLRRLGAEVESNPTNEKLISRNSLFACDIHSHLLLIYKNYHERDYDTIIATTLVGSFVYLTTRHTWNKTTDEGLRLSMPETELYQILQVSRRRLINFLHGCKQSNLDVVMQTALEVSSSLTGSLKSEGDSIDKQNRWCRIKGLRSCGRWAVGASRTVVADATAEKDKDKDKANSVAKRSNNNNNDEDSGKEMSLLKPLDSLEETVDEVDDSENLGVEIDLQLGQMTLRSKHLAALPSEIANHPDVASIFGDATIQASLLERADNRQIYRLVGLNHELHFWPTEHTICPPIGDEWEREYDPKDLYSHEKWISSLFEPIRENFFNGPQPPAMQFMMAAKPTPPDAEVVVLLGLHQSLGGPYKLVYLFRRLRCLHLYECVSQGREWWFTLHLTTDYRYTLREMQPCDDDRKQQFPDWWVNASGEAYIGGGPQECLLNDITGITQQPKQSVLVIRDQQHIDNLTGGSEVYVPERLLYGVVPHALLDAYRFWQDESIAPRGISPEEFDVASRGYKRLTGYPKKDDLEFIIVVEFVYIGNWADPSISNQGNNPHVIQCTGFPGRNVIIKRYPKASFEADFHCRQRIARLLESTKLLVNEIKKKKRKEIEESDKSSEMFKVDQEVECDYEGKGAFWPCIVRRVNDDGTYDLEYVKDYKWVGLQRGVFSDVVQKRGESEKKKKGEGVWRWEGMSESDEDDRRLDDSDDENDKDKKDAINAIKSRLSFYHFDELNLLLCAANYDEQLCLDTIARLAAVPGVEPFIEVRKLARAITYHIQSNSSMVSTQSALQALNKHEVSPKLREDENTEVLLNLLYAPRRSRLFSVLKTLSRIENASHICAWTKAKKSKACGNNLFRQGLPFDCPSIDLIELPRLKLAFTTKVDHAGQTRLFSVDHVDLYISNESTSFTKRIMAGIPHSLLLSNVRGEMQMLVPVLPPKRPIIRSAPFTTFILFDRTKIPLAERFFLYPVHISLSFLMTKGLNSAFYLMLLRFLHRDYADVFRLADSVATDTKLSDEGMQIFSNFKNTTDDWHPDAHACRLKISLVTIDSGTASPWNLTLECAKYISKLDQVSSSCRLALPEELQLLESDKVCTANTAANYDAEQHDDYSMALCFNRQQLLRGLLQKQAADSIEVACRVPPRMMTSNWPYYQDNTVFGENYAQMLDIVSASGDEHSWALEVKGPGGDETDAPPGGWLVVACFHTLWSAACVRAMPVVAELVPLYQDMASFLSVRADCHGMMSISRKYQINVFPTFIIFRGGNELQRFEGGDRVGERLTTALGTHLRKEEDKMAFSKHRDRLRKEHARLMGLEVTEKEEVEERGQLEWTWDQDSCGFNMRIEHDGMQAIMGHPEEDFSFVCWEFTYSVNTPKYKQFSKELTKKIEDRYKTGELYANGYSDNNYEINPPSDLSITSWKVEHFRGVEYSSYRTIYIRRMGERLPVPNEENFLGPEQKEADVRLKQQREKRLAIKLRAQQERVGKDIEAIKGSIGMLKSTGTHIWTLRWDHKPRRFGGSDGIGICSDACEKFGPGVSPLIGGADDTGCSVGVYADGKVYHNGILIHTFDLEQYGMICDPKPVAKTEAAAEASTEQPPADPAPAPAPTPAPAPAPAAAPAPASAVPVEPEFKVLFTLGSKIRVELDTELDGGTVTFSVNSKPLEGFAFKNAYQLLGASEIFPCVCMAPYDLVDPSAVAAAEEEPPKDGSQSSREPKKEGTSTKEGGEEELKEGPFPAVTLLPHEEKKKENAPEQAPVEGAPTDAQPNEPQAAEAQETKKEEASKAAGQGPGTNEKVVEVPIDKVRWMYFTDSGWIMYSESASKEIEQASRDGKSEYTISLGETTHKCNLDSKKQLRSDSDKEYPMRRHIMQDGIQGMWEMLSLRYEKPMALFGPAVVKILEKVWNDGESMSGKECGYGFLFLYALFSGELRCKVAGGGGYGGRRGGGMMGPMNFGGKGGKFGGGFGSEDIKAAGGFSNFQAMSGFGRGGNDSHRFALLLSQLFTDKHTKSLTSSIINVLGRNKQVSLKMPKFKDVRKTTQSPIHNGWTDDNEPRSSVADLMSRLVPMMTQMKRNYAFHFPPNPPFDELSQPPTNCTVSSKDSALLGNWVAPELSDLGCESRLFKQVDQHSIKQLAMNVRFRLGGDELKPQLPTFVEDSAHFDKLVGAVEGRLTVIDFTASWCGPSRAVAPMFKMFAMKIPSVLFLTVDIDVCDEVAHRFNIHSVPNVSFLRGGSTRECILSCIEGAVPDFMEQFQTKLSASITKQERAIIDRFNSNSPGNNIATVLNNMATDEEEVRTLADRPLNKCDESIDQLMRKDLGMENIQERLVFDVSNHSASQTGPAKSVLVRFNEDVATFAHESNNVPLLKMKNLNDAVIKKYFEGDQQATKVLRDAKDLVAKLMSRLQLVQKKDSILIENIVPLLEAASNWVSLEESDDAKTKISKMKFKLSRYAGHNAFVWIEFLFGALLSSSGEKDLLRLNPYLHHNTVELLFGLVTCCMLRANRLGLTNRCIGTAISLSSQLQSTLKIDPADRAEKGATVAPKLIQICDDLVKSLFMKRYYMAAKTISGGSGARAVNSLRTAAYEFDPRYLVFEFIWNIQLRQKQVEIVKDFRASLGKNESKVKQMIMGAGKTSVVAPLLALIVADGKSLVLSVVPKALVEMSRTRMRETFAVIIVKRIYTLEFDRSTVVKPSMRRSLENAAVNRGVVVATPTTLKSIMLSYVEVLQHVQEAHETGIKSKLEELKTQAEELSKILKLFKEGVMLLDEVDLILHPLKSELNFPIGDKFDLDGSADGERWDLPIHLFDGLFYTTTGRVTSFEQRGAALEILERLKATIMTGIENRDLQRLPHVILLNVEFYHEKLKPVVAEWAYLWLLKQHLHGIDKSEAIQYMLEGAAAKTDNSAKCTAIEIALRKCQEQAGIMGMDIVPTRAHQRQLTLTGEPPMYTPTGSSQPRRMTFGLLNNGSSASIDMLSPARSTNDTELTPLQRAEIRHLELAKISATLHRDLVNEIYRVGTSAQELDDLTQDNKTTEQLRSKLRELKRKIAIIENPRDDSLDNCVIVWCSQAFSLNASSNVTPGENSVPSICSILEDNGLTVKRCSDVEEAVSRARDLHEEKQLRCIIVGGDEKAASCGASCTSFHTGDCIRCGKKYSQHNGHECPIGGRGSWLLSNSGAKAIKPNEMFKTLTDEESPYARLHGAIPAARTAVYTAHSVMKEDERMFFWKLGSTVTDDSKHLVDWVQALPAWGTHSASEENEDGNPESSDPNEDSNALGELGNAATASANGKLQRQSTAANDMFRLQELRKEQEEVEDQLTALNEKEEKLKKESQLSAAEHFARLDASVKDRIGILEQGLKELRSIIDLFSSVKDSFIESEIATLRTGPISGRDAAVTLAWIEVNTELLLEQKKLIRSGKSLSIDGKVLKIHYKNLIGELTSLRKMALGAKVMALIPSPNHKKLLNLCFNWLSTFLPHCLAKVNRVSFGLLSAEDCKAALEADQHVPRSRLKLGVPFIGKDVPSKSSEFAHPDVIIGLTVLAYRYSGLRKDDFIEIIDSLTAQFSHEIGPARDRESNTRHEDWVYAAGGSVRGIKATKDGRPWANSAENDTSKEVVQLKFLQKSNEEQMEKLYQLIKTEPTVIHYYMQRSIFPNYMRSQRVKLSASGQAVGGDMLVGKRVGFSGTPSDLLPEELGKCDYEKGDDGMMLTTVLDRNVASYEFLKNQWTVELILEHIAQADPPFNALIDTGALITGYSNLEVARFLLKSGLAWCDGVVFLDDDDRQQVLVRATDRVVSADQCGVSLDKRFAFYDQIHTTGMDIKHVVNATAVITLGKDMVFRDYVQGAYRMRGIGQGQKIHIFIIPEVRELIQRELKDCVFTNPHQPVAAVGEQAVSVPFDHVLEDVVAWLIINSLRSEQTQWTMLCVQNISNLYRKNAFKCLTRYMATFLEGVVSSPKSISTPLPLASEPTNDVLALFNSDGNFHMSPATNSSVGGANQALSPRAGNKPNLTVSVGYEATPSKVVKALSEDNFVASLDKKQAIDMFRESIDFSLDSGVPDPVPFADKLRSMLEDNESFLMNNQHEIGYMLMQTVGNDKTLESGANRLDTEQEREQEQEQEQEVEARRDQQIEVEKFVDREYSRQEEIQRPWPFSILSRPIFNTSNTAEVDSLSSEHPFYKLKDFKLRHQEPLEFDESLYLSSNYFNPNWMGLRRIKNVVMVLEFAPSTDPKEFRLKSPDEYVVKFTAEQESAIQKAHNLLSFHAHAEGLSGVMNRKDIRNAIVAITDVKCPTEDTIDRVIQAFCRNGSTMTVEEFKKLLTSGMLHPVHKGRYWVGVSLAEAETIRRILHLRKRIDSQSIIPNTKAELALRYSPLNGTPSSLAGDGGVIFDSSWGWQTARAGSRTGASAYEAAVAHNSFRFFDCDMHFSEPALNILVRVLKSSIGDRKKFFSSTVGCRRRMERKWQETPLAKVFLVADEFIALRQRAQAIFINEALKARNLTLWEAFTAIDHDNNGLLTPGEFFGALDWLGVPGLCVEDVVDFIEGMDKNRDGLIDYKEYMELLSQDSEESDMADTPSPSAADGGDDAAAAEGKAQTTRTIAKVKPIGAEEIQKTMIKRRQDEMNRERDERLRRQQYHESLDIKIYEEELEASKKREGGANPVVRVHSIGERGEQPVIEVDSTFSEADSRFCRLTDFKFSTNQLPLRCAPTGKFMFLPIHVGTLQYPIKPMCCPRYRAHQLYRANIYWKKCILCKKNGSDFYCSPCWYGGIQPTICNGCYEADKRGQEADKRDPTKHPTFLRCINASNFVMQIPAVGGANKLTNEFTVTLDARFIKLPPKGTLQSLLRFTTPDLTQTKRLHRANIFLNSEGRVVAKPLLTGGEVDEKSSKVIPNKWQEISIVVRPSAGTIRTYVNGVACHVSTELDPEDIQLQHRITVFGGGKQAQSRGGDIRRMQIHGAALEAHDIMRLFLGLAQDNPGLGHRIAKVQAVYRGFHYRRDVKLKRAAAALAKRLKYVQENTDLLVKFVKMQAVYRGYHVRLPKIKAKKEAERKAKEEEEAKKKKEEEEQQKVKAAEEAEKKKAEEQQKKETAAATAAQAQKSTKQPSSANLQTASATSSKQAEGDAAGKTSASDAKANGDNSSNAIINDAEKSKADKQRERKEKAAAVLARKKKEKEEQEERERRAKADQQSGDESNADKATLSEISSEATKQAAQPKRTQVEISDLLGHSDSVMAVQFSADGSRIFSGSDDKSVIIWDSESLSVVCSLGGLHNGGIYAIACSSDGKYLFSGSEDKTIRRWDISNPESISCECLFECSDWIYSLSLSPSADLLAASSEDVVIRVYDVASKGEKFQLEGHTDSVRSVAFSTDGSRLVSGASDMLVKVWDVAKNCEVQTLRGHSDWVFSTCFFPNSNDRVVSGSLDKCVCVWDVTSGVCALRLEGHGGAVYSVCVSANSELIVSASVDKSIRVWDSSQGTCLRELLGHSDCVFAVAFHPRDEAVASASYDHSVKLWRLPC